MSEKAATAPSPHPPPIPSPGTAAPRPPGHLESAISAFWQKRTRPVPASTLVLCAVAGVAGGSLLVGHRLGMGAAVVGAVVWAAAAPVLVRRRAFGDLTTAALSVALVAVCAVRDAGWVLALCLVTAAATAVVAAGSARSALALVLSPFTWAAGVLRTLPWLARGAGNAVGSRRDQVLVAVRSLVVTAVLLVVFGLLFASADTVFASYLPRLDVGLLPAQVVVGTVVALTAATLANLALAPPSWSRTGPGPGRQARLGEWLLPVVALDAMVLAFVLVQVGALLGGHRHVLETAGLTYAEYTRQGFAQLVVATALTLVVVAVAARRAPRVTQRDRLLTSGALGLLCLATLGVVVSALRRMDLYVDAFGLTRLRMLAVVVELVLGAVLVLIVVAGARWRGPWLPRAVVQVVAVAVLALAALNPDAQIVRHNTSAELDVPLDLSYLVNLSADSVPAKAALEEPLRSCLLGRSPVPRPTSGLPDWNLGRARAAALLSGGTTQGAWGWPACQDYQRGDG